MFADFVIFLHFFVVFFPAEKKGKKLKKINRKENEIEGDNLHGQ